MSFASTRPRAALAAVVVAAFVVLGFNAPVAAQTPTISNAFPPALPGLGGIRLTINGANFGGNGGSVSIQGRSVAVPAGGDWGPNSIRVTVPAGDPGSAPVIVQPASGPASDVHFGPFYPAPQLFQLSPASGPAAGGTVITLTGSNFGTLSAVGTVLFGGVEVPMIPVSPSEVQAIAPPRPPGSLQAVSVLINAQPSGEQPYQVGWPSIDSFQPANAPTQGGVVITIEGQNFGQAPDPSPIVKFGGILAPVQSRISQTEIHATVPAGSGVGKSLLVFVGGVESPPSAQLFSYDPPVILGISPEIGPALGGVRITLTGANFGPAGSPRDLQLQPLGGGLAVHGMIAEPSEHGELVADLPPLESGAYAVRLDVEGQLSNAATYEVVGAPVITAVNPPDAPTQGGERITIHGTNFGSAGGRVGVQGREVVVPAGPDWTPEEIQILVPEGDPGPAPIVVLSSGTPGEPYFEFGYQSPVVFSTFPPTVPAAGGAVITISGQNFGTASPNRPVVRMNGKIALCTRLSHELLEVVTPSLPPGSFSVFELEINGISAPPFPIEVDRPSITLVEPPAGPTIGGIPLTIHGLNFGTSGEDPEPIVLVGSQPAMSVERVSDGRITCLLPAGAGADRPVSVLVGGAVGAASPQPFHYFPPQVDLLAPSSGPAEGGVLLTLMGSNFGPPGTERSVRAVDTGGASTPLVVENGPSNQVEVVATVPQLVPGFFDVFVDIAGQESFAGVYEAVAAPPIIQALSSPGGPTLGGVPLTIMGANFGDATGVLRIGLEVANTTAWSRTEISCVTPQGWPGNFPVTVERAPGPGGGGGGSGGGVLYTYDSPQIDLAQPNPLDPAGGVPITIVGQNFGRDGAPRSVLIGGQPAPLLEWRSHHELVVQSPAGTPGALAALCMEFPGVVPACLEVQYGNPVDVAPVFVPTAFNLRLAGANPARGATALAIDLPRAARYRLRIFDPAGRVVRAYESDAAAGAHNLQWDGADARGMRVPAGLYWARLDVAGEKFVRKLLRL